MVFGVRVGFGEVAEGESGRRIIEGGWYGVVRTFFFCVRFRLFVVVVL